MKTQILAAACLLLVLAACSCGSDDGDEADEESATEGPATAETTPEGESGPVGRALSAGRAYIDDVDAIAARYVGESPECAPYGLRPTSPLYFDGEVPEACRAVLAGFADEVEATSPPAFCEDFKAYIVAFARAVAERGRQGLLDILSGEASYSPAFQSCFFEFVQASSGNSLPARSVA
ncbi:MAG: hypothetical protein WEB00_01470 [Dehalococcoidia bacterium]